MLVRQLTGRMALARGASSNPSSVVTAAPGAPLVAAAQTTTPSPTPEAFSSPRLLAHRATRPLPDHLVPRATSHASASACFSTTAASRGISLRATSPTTEGTQARLEPLSSILDASSQGQDDVDRGIQLLTLDRPAAKNAISRQMLDEILAALDHARHDDSLRVLILRSKVPSTFCAGADLKERRTMNPSQVDRFLLDLRRAFSALERLPVPTIAALDGLAMGGGLEMALCVDVRVAGPRADRVGLTETRLGIIPGAGGTHRLSRLVGVSRAKELIFSARLLDAQEAHRLGVVEHLAPSVASPATSSKPRGGGGDQPAIVPGEEGLAQAIALARKMAENGPLALRSAKLAIDRGSTMDTESALDWERACYDRLMGSEDRLEGLRAFAEKRKPKYIGR